jgi:hypothetical protein
MITKELAMIELTLEQKQALLQGQPVRIAIPEIGKEVVLLQGEAYEAICEILEEERERQLIAKVAVHNAGRRLLEDEVL